jgi:predicted amidophosphoribosyltransferase
MRVPQGPETAGFGNCPECAYVSTGTASICFRCASETIEPLSAARCMTCDGRLSTTSGECGNPLCNRSADLRGWEYIYAISMRSGALEKVISRYKYDDVKGWAWIFGRVLAGYLESLLFIDPSPDPWDLIIPMPTYVGDGGRDIDHIDLIVERAEIEAPELPFRRDVMRKTEATPRLVEQPGFAARAQVAERYFGPALEVIDPAAVAGKSVLVFDDVFTSGLTLREVADKLKQAGAKRVGGVVLARQPFRR